MHGDQPFEAAAHDHGGNADDQAKANADAENAVCTVRQSEFFLRCLERIGLHQPGNGKEQGYQAGLRRS